MVELGEEISVEVNTRVRALEFLIQQKGLTGVLETVPTFRSLLVYYDPRATGYAALCEAIAELAGAPEVLHGRLRPGVEHVNGHAITGVKVRASTAALILSYSARSIGRKCTRSPGFSKIGSGASGS